MSRFPLRGRKRLPMRSRKYRRLQLLTNFEPGKVFSFVPIRELDDIPEESLLWHYHDETPDDELDDDELNLYERDYMEPLYGHC